MSNKQTFSTIHLRRGKEESLERRHPWIFSGAIEKISEGLTPLKEGDIVDVVFFLILQLHFLGMLLSKH